MSQQQHEMFLDYSGGPSNRSPSSSRPGFPGPNPFQSAFSLPRQSQRPFDANLNSANLYPAGERAGNAYGGRGLDQLPPGGGGPHPNSYMLENVQSWNYNAANVTTVNGAMNGANRGRGRRAALPPTWTDSAMGMHQSHQAFHSQPSGLNGSHLGNGMRLDQNHHMGVDLRGPSNASDAEQLIPTAIVIKNIPFAVRKESLAQLMVEMHLPQPYAFNYHFDNGVFRGLAFANFQSPEDTRAVIEAMNGLDVQGRKLRVEYKKMLPEAERERIEREKRERRGQLEEQHRAPMLHQQSSMQTLASLSSGQQPRTSHLRDIDLNDPQTLEYYTELMIFRRDDSREILVFPASITPEQRRQIHILAHHMGLEHQSVGDADSRQIHVIKRPIPSPTSQLQNATAVSLDLHKRGLSRAATYDFTSDREARSASNAYSHAIGRQGPTLELPGSPDGNGLANNLRAAKSFADLRSFSPSPSHSSSSYLNPGVGLGSIPSGAMPRLSDYAGSLGQSNSAVSLGAPGLTPVSSAGQGSDAGLLSSLGGLNLGSFDGGAGHMPSRPNPGAIGSQRPGANSASSRNIPDRQPRGPEWESSLGFGGRGRQNGHGHRGSGDSSENDSRAGAPVSNVTRF